jgi:hypothetical protein
MLRGACVTAVVYYPLTGGDDGTVVEEWDFGPWHQPTMGVELITDDGSHFSAVWGSSFDHYGLEVFPEPMTHFLTRIGEPAGSAAVTVTDHPRWARLVGATLVSADIAWSEDLGDTDRLPVAIRLRSSEATVWIAVGRPAVWPPTGDYYLCTDDVMVVFTHECATEVGIPDIA